MEENNMIEITLSDQERKQLILEFKDISYDPLGGEHYIQLVRRKIYKVLSETLINMFTCQRSTSSLASAIIINNAPIDEVVYGSPRFEQTGKLFKSGTLSENIITAFASLVGEPYSIYFEGQELVNNLTPQLQNRLDYTGLGSEVELDFHIENAALQYVAEDDYSPAGIFFLGLRVDANKEPTKTFIADTRKALKLLNPNDLMILYGKNFYLNLPYRWREIFSHDAMVKCPVLRGTLNKPRVSVAFYSNMILPINSAAKLALANFHQAVKETSEIIQITPGKLIYVDNRFTLHARERFTPTYDSQGNPYRWIQRVFVSPSLWAFRNFQTLGGRVFLPHSNQGRYNHVSAHIPEVA